MEADLDRDGKISFDEFKKMVENTDVSMSMTLGKLSPAVCPVQQAVRYGKNMTDPSRPVLRLDIGWACTDSKEFGGVWNRACRRQPITGIGICRYCFDTLI